MAVLRMLLVGGASRLSADKASRNLCCPIEINQEEELCSCADSMVKNFLFLQNQACEAIWRENMEGNFWLQTFSPHTRSRWKALKRATYM